MHYRKLPATGPGVNPTEGNDGGRLFFLFESGEEVWGNTPEETLAHVNARIAANHH